jgi:hypothetical protein
VDKGEGRGRWSDHNFLVKERQRTREEGVPTHPEPPNSRGGCTPIKLFSTPPVITPNRAQVSVGKKLKKNENEKNKKEKKPVGGGRAG